MTNSVRRTRFILAVTPKDGNLRKLGKLARRQKGQNQCDLRGRRDTRILPLRRVRHEKLAALSPPVVDSSPQGRVRSGSEEAVPSPPAGGGAGGPLRPRDLQRR